jgi:hypothetical protein
MPELNLKAVNSIDKPLYHSASNKGSQPSIRNQPIFHRLPKAHKFKIEPTKTALLKQKEVNAKPQALYFIEHVLFKEK